MATQENEVEILRDIPRLYEKIAACNATKASLQEGVFKERELIEELHFYIRADADLVKVGLKPRYETAAMEENIVRHRKNIELFKEKMANEDSLIASVKEIIKVLEQDLKRPEEIIIDMRQPPQFRNMGDA